MDVLQVAAGSVNPSCGEHRRFDGVELLRAAVLNVDVPGVVPHRGRDRELDVSSGQVSFVPVMRALPLAGLRLLDPRGAWRSGAGWARSCSTTSACGTVRSRRNRPRVPTRDSAGTRLALREDVNDVGAMEFKAHVRIPQATAPLKCGAGEKAASVHDRASSGLLRTSRSAAASAGASETRKLSRGTDKPSPSALMKASLVHPAFVERRLSARFLHAHEILYFRCREEATRDLSVVVDGAVALSLSTPSSRLRHKRAREHAARMRQIELDAAFRRRGELRLAVKPPAVKRRSACRSAAQPRKEDAQRAATQDEVVAQFLESKRVRAGALVRSEERAAATHEIGVVPKAHAPQLDGWLLPQGLNHYFAGCDHRGHGLLWAQSPARFNVVIHSLDDAVADPNVAWASSWG